MGGALVIETDCKQMGSVRRSWALRLYHLHMLDTLFANGNAWFTVPALIGTSLFVIRLVLMLLGAGGHHDGGIELGHGADGTTGADGGAAGGADPHSHASEAFKYLSIQSVSAFAMGFGWAAFAAKESLHWGFAASTGLGVVGGVGMAALLLTLLKSAMGLNASGNIDMSKAVGAAGDVYVEIPPGQQGKVRLILQERARFFTAVSDGATGETLARHARVVVTRVNADGTVAVRKA
jgi:hypothetical protein